MFFVNVLLVTQAGLLCCSCIKSASQPIYMHLHGNITTSLKLKVFLCAFHRSLPCLRATLSFSTLIGQGYPAMAAARPGCGWTEPLTPPNCKPLARFLRKEFNRFCLNDKILCRRTSKIYTECSTYSQNGS